MFFRGPYKAWASAVAGQALRGRWTYHNHISTKLRSLRVRCKYTQRHSYKAVAPMGPVAILTTCIPVFLLYSVF